MILKFGSNLPYEFSHLGQLSRPVNFFQDLKKIIMGLSNKWLNRCFYQYDKNRNQGNLIGNGL